MKTNKRCNSLIVFGCLDALAFFVQVPRLIRFFYLLCFSLSLQTPSEAIIMLLQAVLYITYVFLAYGFLRERNWAFVLYYCGFILRFGFCTGTMAFLSPINSLLGSLLHPSTIGLVILLGELLRLRLTIGVHKRRIRAENSGTIKTTHEITQEQEPRVSKWATASMYSASTALVLLVLILVPFFIGEPSSDVSQELAFELIGAFWDVAAILIIFGFVASIISLICIKFSKSNLKGAGRAFLGLLLGLLLIAIVLSVTIVERQIEKTRTENTIKNNK